MPGPKPRKSYSQRTKKRVTPGVRVGGRPEEYLYEVLDETAVPFVLILDGVQDPHNLGACLRTAAAAGVDVVVAPRDRSASLTEAARAVSAGGAEVVPFVQVTNLARTMDELRKAGVWLVGTSDRADKSLYESDLTGPVALVLGSEGKGLRRLTTEKCDFVASIPMSGKVECLNVSVAAGVCIFEAVRQRSSK